MKILNFNTEAGNHPTAKNAGYPCIFSDEFEVSYTPVRSGIYNIFLFGPIEDTSQFTSAIQVLQAATENDIVITHLSTPGGNLDATDTFVAAMRECEARIITKASGGVHSAGSIILLNSDEFVLSENFNCLIHNGGAYCGGKFSDWKAEVKHAEKYMEKVLHNSYAGFLTEKELSELLAGKDFWLDAEEFIRRYHNRNEYLKSKIEAGENSKLTALLKAVDEAESEQQPEAKPRKTRKKKVVQEVTQ